MPTFVNISLSNPLFCVGSLGRMVLLILFVSLTFLYTSYSANIVALLQSSSSQIRTLEDLLRSRMKFGVHDTVFNKYYFTVITYYRSFHSFTFQFSLEFEPHCFREVAKLYMEFHLTRARNEHNSLL